MGRRRGVLVRVRALESRITSISATQFGCAIFFIVAISILALHQSVPVPSVPASTSYLWSPLLPLVASRLRLSVGDTLL